MMLRCGETRVRNYLYTEQFLMVPGWFEIPESQLSDHPGTIKNGSVYSWLRSLFWSQRSSILPPPLH